MTYINQELDLKRYPIVADLVDHTLHQSILDETYFAYCRKASFLDKSTKTIAELRIVEKDAIRYFDFLEEPSERSAITNLILVCITNLKWNSIVLLNNGLPSVSASIKYIGENYPHLGVQKLWFDPRSGVTHPHTGYPDIPNEYAGWSVLINNPGALDEIRSRGGPFPYMFDTYDMWATVYAPLVHNSPMRSIRDTFRLNDEPCPEILKIMNEYGIPIETEFKTFGLANEYLHTILNENGLPLVETFDTNYGGPTIIGRGVITCNRVCLYGHEVVQSAFHHKYDITIIDIGHMTSL